MANKKISQLPAAATLDGAELVELSQGGVSVQSTSGAVRNAGVKVYRAFINQAGTGAPVATVLENTLGGTPVWTRSDVGTYAGTLIGAFPANKTVCSVNMPVGGDAEAPGIVCVITRTSDNALGFLTGNTGILQDDLLNPDFCCEILVYP